MAPEDCRNLVHMLLMQADRRGERPFLFQRRDGSWTHLSWAETVARITRLSEALIREGIEPGDRVALISENRPEWLIADFAIMAAGAITVPAYTTSTTRDYLHILDNSRAKGAIVSTARLGRTVLPAAHEADSLEFVLMMEDPAIRQSINARIIDWDRAMSESPCDIPAMRERVAALGRDDLACLIYTSGTGGAPKGVMLHHGAILHNCTGAIDVLMSIGLENNSFLSLLPLSHAYEHTAGQALPVSIGAEIHYAEGLDKLASNMAEVRPTIMVVVPRLFEMLRNRVLHQVEKEGGLKLRLFERALALGIERYRRGGRLPLRDRLSDAVLDRLVRARIRKRFGGRLKALVSGGAPLNREVGEFFVGLGLPLLQGYGQTESAPLISVNRPGKAKTHTVGPPVKGVDVRIAEDGEILVRGELVMKGYWEDERATAVTIRDGWLHTGDIGLIDEDGHLVITDRKKDLIVTDKGENVSPQRVEGMLAFEPEIAQVMVHGDDRPYLVAVIVPDSEWLAGWARENGKPCDLAAVREDRAFRAALDEAVSRVNRRLSTIEKVRRFIVAREPFSVDNEQMTPTMKIRRHVISRLYGDEIAALYRA